MKEPEPMRTGHPFSGRYETLIVNGSDNASVRTF
jgi:hypothetical protein